MKILSLGGSCYSFILNKLINARVPGPIDNIRCKKGIQEIEYLFNGKAREELLHGKYNKYIDNNIIGTRETQYVFDFEDYTIVHNDYEKLKYKEVLSLRFDNLLYNVDYYSYLLNMYDDCSTVELELLLKKVPQMNKLIVIGTISDRWPNYNISAYKEFFGNRYILIENATDRNLALNKYKNFLNM